MIRRLSVQGPLFWLLVLLPVSVAGAQVPRISMDEVRFMEGDDDTWADPAFDDSSWPAVSLWQVRPEPSGRGIVWIRGEVVLSETSGAAPGPEYRPVEHRPVGMRFMALAACQLFWDGELLAENGVVGVDRAAERPGMLDWMLPLPPSASTVGRHDVALRCSTHHRGFEPFVGFHAFWIGDYLGLALAGRGYVARTLVSAGGLLSIGLFYSMVFALGTRSRANLWLGLFAVSAGALVIVESLRVFAPYTYDWHLWRLLAITALAWATNLLLVLFLGSRYPLPGRRSFWLAALGLTALCLAAPAFDAKAGLLFLVGLTFALGWSVYALHRRRAGAGFAVSGLLLCLGVAALKPRQFLDYYLFFGLAALCLFLLASHVLAEARERRRHEATQLRSARLEIELLRRHLQPHFLMNTLTALSEWFEEEPEVAAQMVQDLGQELRLLAEISSRERIPMAQELALCRSHLAVMARRRDEHLLLDSEGVDEAAEVPPAIFHTLLENALTHNSFRGDPARFRLRQETVGKRRRYVFEAPHRPRRRGDVREGTGLRYIRARLRESYGDRFSLTGGEALDRESPLWRTVIEMPNEMPGHAR